MPALACIQCLKGHEDRVWNVAWSPQGTHLASCSGDRTARVWKNVDGQWVSVAQIADHSRTVRRCAWYGGKDKAESGLRLALASFDSTISIHMPQGDVWKKVNALEGHECEVKGVAWDADGEYLASCSRDKSVWIWRAVDEGKEFDCVAVLRGHSGDVKSLTFHPCGAELFSCSYDETIRVWKCSGDDWMEIDILSGHKSTVWEAQFDHSGNYLVSASADGNLRLWTRENSGCSTSSWECLDVRKAHDGPVYGVAVGPHNLVASAGGDDAIVLHRMELDGKGHSGRLRHIYTHVKAHDGDVNGVAWHPSLPLLASAGDDSQVRIWNLLDHDDVPLSTI